ncbi:hypothetical protein N658DRAFT_496894 [Parathielavia hyrcaniae]|uniref:Uncharacterized protein n=1 Tax=Parathielavia hyrcaniae TaxID=113614 RepID=A0AAN6Q201_9PEZI|nr:hypothetical protein N658DRAFT_496894 [Parathielavia hyrcaniae]
MKVKTNRQRRTRIPDSIPPNWSFPASGFVLHFIIVATAFSPVLGTYDTAPSIATQDRHGALGLPAIMRLPRWWVTGRNS